MICSRGWPFKILVNDLDYEPECTLRKFANFTKLKGVTDPAESCCHSEVPLQTVESGREEAREVQCREMPRLACGQE